MQRSAWLLLGLLASPSLAQDVGTVVPEMHWKTRLNWGEIRANKLSDLRGSAVLLEFFTTGENGCIAQVPRLCALHENEFKNGLVVIGVTGDAEFAVKLFISDHDATYPIGIGGGSGFHVDLVPHSILVDPDGLVVWNGPSTELEPSMLQRAMVAARPATYAEGLGEVAKLMAVSQFGDAYAACKHLLAGDSLGADARSQAERICRLLEADAKTVVDAGATALQAGELYAAVAEFERAGQLYGGMPGVAEALAQAAELRADKKTLREIEAGEQFCTADELEAHREYDRAYDAYQLIRRRLSGTQVSKKADARARAIKKDGKLGFMRGCGACEALDKACELHQKHR
jgi:AhpC/TSA family